MLGGRSWCQAGGHGARREVMLPVRSRVARQVRGRGVRRSPSGRMTGSRW